jgi:ADP-heptose:LPS heptosyltransferase
MNRMNLRWKTRIDNVLGSVLILVLNPLAYLLGLLLRRDHGLRVQGDILVLKMLGGGSLVMAFPALLAIRRAYPDRCLSLLTTPAVKAFAETLGVFDRIHVIDDRSAMRLFRSGIACMWRCLGADTVIDLEVYSKLTTVLSLAVLGRNRVGFFIHGTFWRKNLHTHLLFFNPFSGVYFFYDEIARRLGATIPSVAECADHLRKHLAIDARASRAGRIAIGHACSDMARERMLSPAQWRKVFDARLPAGGEVNFIGAVHDRTSAEGIIAALHGLECEIHNQCGNLTLAESVRLLAASGEFWGIDSALLHYARLLGIPCISYWGPVDPSCRLRPVPGLREEILYKKIPCSPCIHIAGVPPCHGQNVCMEGLFEESGGNARPIPVFLSSSSREFREQ